MSASHAVKVPKKLIEVALPLDDINAAAAKEKSIRHGHPSTLHLWWARRPLAAARAVIFAQLVNDPSWKWELEHPNETPKQQHIASWAKQRKKLFDILRKLVLWENTNNQTLLHEANAIIRKSWRETCEINRDHPQAASLFNPDKLPGLHDPFAGGGTIPLEAQRLGLDAYASDLNPVAVLINKAMIEIPPRFAHRPPVGPSPTTTKGKKKKSESLLGQVWQGASGLAEDVRRYGAWMRQQAFERIGHLYPPITITQEMIDQQPDLEPYKEQSLTVIAWLWARTVKSPNPAFRHVDVPLVSSFILSKKDGRKTYIQPLVEGDAYRFTIQHGSPPDDAENGTSAGKRQAFRCILSDTPIDYNYIRAEGKAGRMGARLLAIVVEGKSKRLYLEPTPEAEDLAQQAKPAWKPRGDVPKKLTGGTCATYGLEDWGDLFTPRQLVALNTFSELVSQAREQCRLDYLRAKHPTTPLDEIPPSTPEDDIPLEQGGSGATAYADAIAVYLSMGLSRMSDICNSLCRWEITKTQVRNLFARQAIPMIWDFAENNVFGQAAGDYEISLSNLLRTLENLKQENMGEAFQKDVQIQTLSSGRFVSTDPPYYDNIGYADLSDFFYVWLRRSLRSIFPSLFATMAVPKEEELVASPYRHGGKEKAEAFFLEGMTKAMQNLAELAHPGTPITIYYAFKQSETKGDQGTTSTGWVTFLEAVLKAGLMITGTWPMRTELSNRMIGAGNNALASSVVLVCRPRPESAVSLGRRQFKKELDRVLTQAHEDMTKGDGEERSPVAPVDLSQAMIGPGMAIFSRYKAVLEADGRPMSVESALMEINRYLGDDEFDAETQFCLLWFEQYAWNEKVFGDADTLSRAKGTSVEKLQREGMLDAGGGKARLHKRSEYDPTWQPTPEQRSPIWKILHGLLRVFEGEGERGAAKVLAKVKEQMGSVRVLAYRLYTLCERAGLSDDAKSYNDMITSWDNIEEAASKLTLPKQMDLL